MPLVAISDDLKELLDENLLKIKGDYLTLKLFVDSAIRQKLRSMDIEAGQDEVIAHLQKLQASKSRHIDKRKVKEAIARHKRRTARAKKRLDNLQ